ncbi:MULTISPECIES: FAD-binding dehydrogenase [Glycomyces]|uniref:FAD-binding dehydrogenase n=2 Tax=Glycomyces TaxID=58113 RepID=A0A9X3PPB2_9ACTN|nr:FAD-binding dehydrogenase [Glycomyces lechevalierae]MDA1387348.1 FAD-binding dehydrogenase [Glycomyces lechevalierae]MDR7340100.1 putative oxidoreductase [Glycomyces lechevalierae]
MDSDVIVVGAGLAGLAAAVELVGLGKSVTVLEQEGEQSLGGQAFWSFGGLFLVDSPEQRRMGIKDSHELAWQDWLGTAGFDRPEDEWPRKWAEAYVDFASGEKRAWLHAMGVRFFPVVGWAERGGYTAQGHGNSVPRFHITWGTGPGIVEPFAQRVRQAERDGKLQLKFRHRVDQLVTTDGVVTGVSGTLLSPDESARGVATTREALGEFELGAEAVVVTSGGIGGNFDLVRQNWPERLGKPPKRLISGVPAHVDGRMLGIAEAAGANLINRDRMWHYTEGIENWDPIWPHHGIRILPGPSSLWLDATGKRLPAPLFPGFDTLGTLEHIMTTGHEYTWFVLTQKILEKEFALSGSEQNPDLTGKDIKLLLKRVLPGAPAPVEAFKKHGADFAVAATLPELVAKMNGITGEGLLDYETVRAAVEARDAEMDNKFTKDLQITALRGARNYRGDKLIRVASPHRLLDPKAGPLIGVRLNLLTRKTLGGLQTDLDGRVLRADGSVLPGLYAAGEAAGFGGGGMHGYRSLEGTFLGGCLFSGRQAARGVAKEAAG